jgi:hypothetical protein
MIQSSLFEKIMEHNCMWEILVPTVKPNTDATKFFTTKYHKEWDAKVKAITGGLTIMTPAKGQWLSPHGINFEERMIPVRLIATRVQMETIIDITIEHYSQEAVLCYKISDEVILRHSKSIKNDS